MLVFRISDGVKVNEYLYGVEETLFRDVLVELTCHTREYSSFRYTSQHITHYKMSNFLNTFWTLSFGYKDRYRLEKFDSLVW